MNSVSGFISVMQTVECRPMAAELFRLQFQWSAA